MVAIDETVVLTKGCTALHVEVKLVRLPSIQAGSGNTSGAARYLPRRQCMDMYGYVWILSILRRNQRKQRQLQRQLPTQHEAVFGIHHFPDQFEPALLQHSLRRIIGRQCVRADGRDTAGLAGELN